MNHTDHELSNLIGARVSNILAQGFIDHDGPRPRFVPLSDVWYLVVDDGFITVSSYRNDGQLTVQRVSDTPPPIELDGEDEEFGLASLGVLFFDTAGPELPITKIRYLVDERSDPTQGIVRYVEFELSGSTLIGFDPMHHFGIRPTLRGSCAEILADGHGAGQTLKEFVLPSTRQQD